MGKRSRRNRLSGILKPKVRALTAIAQMRDMAAKFPEFTAYRRGNEASWEGNFKPSGGCASYLVRIDALSGQRPRVKVIDPPLRIRPDQYRETHCFNDGSLCLHLHEQWTADMLVADTIIRWIPVWLINYEYWLATGMWFGGGQHPEPEGNT